MPPKSKQQPNTKYIFVVGGVMSGVGKGVTTASIGCLLQSKGYTVSAIKMDPYINVDAGTMNPVEHGEVFVTEDGDETDQDIGNYERFLNQNIYKENYMTTGRIYQEVIKKERDLKYGGKCVQVVPHIPMEIRDRIKQAVTKTDAEIMIIEVGGTVGEYENVLFLEAARMMKLKNPDDVSFIMVSYLPFPSKVGEMKTKPTQHAVRNLNSSGIQPSFIIARSEYNIDTPRREKIAMHCNMNSDNVIGAPDADSIYDIPLNFEKHNLGERILDKLNLNKREDKIGKWSNMVQKTKQHKKEIDIGIVGKYFATGNFSLSDSYISVIEAIKHASAEQEYKTNLHWINCKDIDEQDPGLLDQFDGVVVPQGWGSRGSEAKIKTIKYCRENNIPYLGLCYGMQMAVIEYARHVCSLENANSAEIDPDTSDPVIHIMPDQEKLIQEQGYGGTIRLGAWPCKIQNGTKLQNAYEQYGHKDTVQERHRHRFEFNNEYRELLQQQGLTISGTSPDEKIVEAIELKDHPFFVGVQFHPEYISRPLRPHPLFVNFLQACGNKN